MVSIRELNVQPVTRTAESVHRIQKDDSTERERAALVALGASGGEFGKFHDRENILDAISSFSRYIDDREKVHERGPW